VLAANPAYVSSDTRAGIRLAELDLSWAAWEPAEGSYSSSYISSIVDSIDEYRSQGWQISISPGFQSPPSWVMGLEDGNLIDQNGNTAGLPDYEFSAAVDQATEDYVEDLVSHLHGLVTYYRDGLSEAGEMLFPDTTSNQWWAFPASAQCRNAADLPAGVACTPMPGWVPGQSAYDGAPVTVSQAASWWSWYETALVTAEVNVITWFRSAGYSGAIQLVMPGDGASPALIARRESDLLAAESFDSYYTMNSGAAWQILLGDSALKNQSDIVIDISSVGDGSGDNNVCTASDQSVSLADADPSVSGWSDTRWIVYLSHLNGYDTVVGENPGDNSESQLGEIFALVKGCGLAALQWAWDANLYEGGNQVSLAQYQAAFATG
jgi:hypothetical protein